MTVGHPSGRMHPASQLIGSGFPLAAAVLASPLGGELGKRSDNFIRPLNRVMSIQVLALLEHALPREYMLSTTIMCIGERSQDACIGIDNPPPSAGFMILSPRGRFNHTMDENSLYHPSYTLTLVYI